MIKTALLAAAAYLVALCGSARANEVDVLWVCVSDEVADFLSVPRSSEDSVQRISAACAKQIDAAVFSLLEQTNDGVRDESKPRTSGSGEPVARRQIHDALVHFVDKRMAEMPKPSAVETYFACVDDEIEASRQLRNIDAIVQAIHLHCAKERQASDAAIFSNHPNTAEGERSDQPLVDYVESKLH